MKMIVVVVLSMIVTPVLALAQQPADELQNKDAWHHRLDDLFEREMAWYRNPDCKDCEARLRELLPKKDSVELWVVQTAVQAMKRRGDRVIDDTRNFEVLEVVAKGDRVVVRAIETTSVTYLSSAKRRGPSRCTRCPANYTFVKEDGIWKLYSFGE